MSTEKESANEVSNYSDWKTTNRAILEKFSDKRVMIPFSGGKDSSVVLFLIQKAAEEFDFSCEVHGVLFPSRVYSAEALKKIDSYWCKRNTKIVWHKAPVSDECLAEALKGGQTPCLTCIQMKKSVLQSQFKTMISDWSSICDNNELFSLGSCECHTRTYIKIHFF